MLVEYSNALTQGTWHSSTCTSSELFKVFQRRFRTSGVSGWDSPWESAICRHQPKEFAPHASSYRSRDFACTCDHAALCDHLHSRTRLYPRDISMESPGLFKSGRP